jgi:hypothetical protein
VTYKGDRPIIKSNVAMLITDIALSRANFKMIFSFIKKLVKYYVDKFIHWLRMQKFNLELDNDIKKYHEELDKKVKKPKIVEKGTFGEDGWSISIGNVDKNE